MLSQARGLLAASSTIFGANNTKKAPEGDEKNWPRRSPGHHQIEGSETNRSNWRSKFKSSAGKLENKSDDNKKTTKSNQAQSTLPAVIESEPNSSVSSSSLDHNNQRQRARHSRKSSTPSCGDLSSGYLSQTNGHLAASSTAQLRPQRAGVMSEHNQAEVDRRHKIEQNVHTSDKLLSGSLQANSLYQTHSIASSSTLTRLPMVPMMIDDEDEQFQFGAENEEDAEEEDGQNVLIAGDDFNNSSHHLHSHQSYQLMIDGLKRRQRQLQRQQQQLGALAQHDDHLHHHHHLQLHHPLSQRLAIDEMSLAGDRADSDQIVHDFDHRLHYKDQFDHNHQLTHHLAFALASSQNLNALAGYVPRNYVPSQAHEAAAVDLDREQLARELAFRRSQFSTVDGQHYTKLNHLNQQQQQQQRTYKSPISSKSAGVSGSSSSTSSGKHSNHLRRLKPGPIPPAPPVRGQQQVVGAQREDNAAAGRRRRAQNQQQHQLGSEPRPLQRAMIASENRYNLAPEYQVKGNKNHQHRNLKTSSNLTRPVLKSATTTSLLMGGSENNILNAANLPRSASQMQVGDSGAHSNGSVAQHQHQTVAVNAIESIGCCGRLAKFLLFIANILFWCAGVALGAWGILGLVEDHKYNLSQLLVFEPSSRMSLFQLLAWSFITLGGATILIGICGCSAMLKNSRWILGLYIFLILAIFALDLATGLLAIIFQERLVANVRLRLVSKLRNEYGIQASFTAAIDYIQTRFECCGLDGHFDYEQSLWRLQRLGGFEATVARTCCHLRNTLDDQAHVNPRPVNESMCQSTDVRFHQSYRFRRGCLDDLEKLIRYKIWTFTIGCGVVGATILVVLALATCFCRSIPNNSQNGSSNGKKSASNSSTSRKIPASRVQQQALMYSETLSKKQGHQRHGHH